ncbi:hypothetical protein QNO26_01090 [Microbacterium wangruii]|uniref:hypothetical protein n=1 Tax=Microbacterium wangruii TaxID=3049073 RepID=UPI00254C0E88|nr:hypothetical protein [Microbacterium sp. zg-Y1090]WIM28518.1 hypothetical protein QNO26_01090 [Microbacterium sp. zg-Y1090]
MTAVVAVVLALGGCAAERAELPEGVAVTVQQLRSDVAARTAQVRVVNDSAEDLRIDRVELQDDRFIGALARERDSTVPAGRTVDLRIELSASDCSVPSDARAESTVVVTTADGTAHRVRAADPLGFIAALHERECLAAAVAAVTSLSWGAFTPSAPGAPAALRLDLVPTGAAGTVRIVDVRPTNLLQFAAPSTDPFPVGREIDGRDGPSSIQVPLVPLRCDAHAVQEDKRGTVFVVAVETAGAEGVIEVAATAEHRGAILAWVARWCGFG